ncbi:MAG: glycosyltransferase family 4 protein [Lentisphaeria bacterium]|nr:glycosyltransferase family 4 protein [Lentisphaeria bacterium]
MKIALACFKYSSAAAHPQDLVRLARELHERGHRVSLYCSFIAPGSVLPDFLAVRRLNGSSWGNAGRAGKFIRGLREALRQDGPDVLVAFNRIPGADFYYATTRCIAATPLTGFALLKKLLPRYRFNLALERRIFGARSKTRILHVSDLQKREYQRAYGTPDGRFFKLPPDIPAGCGRPADAPERRERIRKELGVEEGDILLLCVGNFRIAGADRAVGALASLPEMFRERCQLVLAGNGRTSALRRLARRLGVQDRVRFTAVDDGLNDFLLGADLLLHPARGESAGTAPLQALCAGLPVLATAAGGWAREIVRADGVLLPAPFHQVELNRTLRMLLSTPLKLGEMAREAAAVGGSLDLKRRFDVAADIITGSVS